MSYELFLDSGAFSINGTGSVIDIRDYIDFIKVNRENIDIYANLDVIDNPEETLYNQRIMEEAGLNPLPCFHMGEDWKYLHYYVDKYDYIALGGIARVKGEKLVKWLDECFAIINMKRGIKVHGYGITEVEVLWRYKWESVDSTSWFQAAGNGYVFIPQPKHGKYDYRVQPWSIKVSNDMQVKGQTKNNHWDNLSTERRSYCLKYIQDKNYKLGESTFKLVENHYECLKDEVNAGLPRKDGKKWVEVIIETGISNDYRHRLELNAIFFMHLEKALNEQS